ncbi:hypothetical protein SAMN05428940_4637 [Streptomyces sp. 2133.1]|nr:hypothetical protein BX261_4609 [Streptomyces sp. 2321.6]SED37993.1 hypothetical protein SAMN05428940_4637 [Streptomyces sp. 2133.1]
MAKRCDGFNVFMHQCPEGARWMVKRRDMVFSWFYACSEHLDQVCSEQEDRSGQKLELVRLSA